MKILGLGTPELVIILVVVLLIFGPKNLPKLGSAIGKSVKSLREGLGSGKKEIEEAADDEEVMTEAAELDEAEEEPVEKPAKKRVVKKAAV